LRRKAFGLRPRTCGAFAHLDICEVAHRHVKKQPLCLRDEDVQVKNIYDHLTLCPQCDRLFQNACRSYEADDGLSPAPPAPPVDTAPQSRHPVEVDFAATDPGSYLQLLKPLPGGQGLDPHEVQLEWWETQADRDEVRWWLTLKVVAQGPLAGPTDTNSLAALRKLDGYSVRLERWVEGRSEPDRVVTRLGFDSERNLVSIPRSLGKTHPAKTDRIVLTLLERAKEIVGD
jgi:hypothetical protein